MARKSLTTSAPQAQAQAKASVASDPLPVQRMRAADHVFEALSRAILTGELKPGTTLPTQRELARQFAVSTLVVQQATHRLGELGLVSVRQGSTTTVSDPNGTSDVQLMQLRLELAVPGDLLALAARESQALSVLPILALAQRRITDAELDALDRLVDALREPLEFRHSLHFRVEFWGRLVRATHNPVMAQQVRWWAKVMQDLEKRSGADPIPTSAPTALKPRYRGLMQALRRRRRAPQYWLEAMQQVLDWSESHSAHAMNQSRDTTRKRS